MKRYFSVVVVALSLLLGSCENRTEEPVGVGTLDMSAITATVSTRALTDNWVVTLTGESGVVGEWRYAELPEKVELREGNYTNDVASHSHFAEVSREGYFVGSEEETIVSGKTTTPDAVTCRIQSLKVSVVFEGEIVEAMADDCQTTISLGEVSLSVGKDDAEPVYFRPLDVTNTLHIDFAGTVDGAAEHFATDIAGVKVGQWRKIVIKMTYEDGERVFGASIVGWSQDDDIYVE